jgi:hypothetical protein
MEKGTSQTPSQRSASTEHEYRDSPNCGDVRHAQKKTWLQKLNPFSAGEVPPIPAGDAGLVPDLQANWWDKLTWGWMGPLMMVYDILCLFAHEFRLAIKGHCRKKIYGIMMNRGELVILQINSWRILKSG